jgi:hypothetical protein
MRFSRVLSVAVSVLFIFLSLFLAGVDAAHAATVSGTVSYSGSRTGTIYVGLFSNPILTPGVPAPLYATTLSIPGAYTIAGVPNGTYYLGAIRTNDINAIQVEDPYGMYGIDFISDFTADPVTISGGASVIGKNFIMIDGTQQYPNPFYSTGFPIATTSARESALSSAFDGTNYLVAFQEAVGEVRNIKAQLVSQNGTLVGPAVTVGLTGGVPAVAFDGTNYLLVSPQSTSSIQGQFVSKSGSLVGPPFNITTSGTNIQYQDMLQVLHIIFDGENYFVVWGDQRNLKGRFVSPAGGLVGGTITIVSGTAPDPDIPSVFNVGFGGNKIFVVWADGRRPSSGGCPYCPMDIYGQFITKSWVGTAGVLSGSNFAVNVNDDWSDMSTIGIAFDGTNYLVTWNDMTPDTENSRLYAQMVSTSGGLVGGVIDTGNSNANRDLPSLAFDGNNYLLIWTSTASDLNGNNLCDAGEGTCFDIYGRYISKSGALVGTTFPVNTDQGHQFGSIIFDGGKYFVTYSNIDTFGGPVGDVYGKFISVPPAAPSSLTAKPTSPTSIVLGWKDNSDNETGFKIERKSGGCTSANAWAQITTKAANVITHTNTGLTTDTAYSYRIRAYNAGGNSSYTSCVSATTGLTGTPNAPTGLKATSASASKINLAWTDNSTDETSFKIYRKTNSGTFSLLYTTAADAVSFSDAAAAGDDLTNSYSYYISACNAAGCSPATNTAAVPFKPTGLTTSAVSSTQINLSWTDNSSNETGFEVYRKAGDCSSTNAWTLIKTTAANAKSFNNTGLTSGQTYSYRLRSFTKSSTLPYANGYSVYTGCSSKTTP